MVGWRGGAKWPRGRAWRLADLAVGRRCRSGRPAGLPRDKETHDGRWSVPAAEHAIRPASGCGMRNRKWSLCWPSPRGGGIWEGRCPGRATDGEAGGPGDRSASVGKGMFAAKAAQDSMVGWRGGAKWPRGRAWRLVDRAVGRRCRSGRPAGLPRDKETHDGRWSVPAAEHAIRPARACGLRVMAWDHARDVDRNRFITLLISIAQRCH